MIRPFLSLLFMAFLWTIQSVCMAAEQPANKPHHLADAISIIRQNQILSDEALQSLSATELKIVRNAVSSRSQS